MHLELYCIEPENVPGAGVSHERPEEPSTIGKLQTQESLATETSGMVLPFRRRVEDSVRRFCHDNHLY